MVIQIEPYQRLNQKDYCEITLINDNGMQVTLLNYGATLEKIRLPQKDGTLRNVILTLPTPEDYSRTRNYLGGVVGRICGRVRKGQWQYGATTVQLPLNDGVNHSHGGDEGTDTQVFNFQTYQTATEAVAQFTLLDPAGHNGYPGNLKLIATYTLTNDNALLLQLTAVSDALTILNPANHVYFSLNGSGTTILNNQLQLNSAYYYPLDTTSLPKVGMMSVADTVFDFRKGVLIRTVLQSEDPEIKAENGLNHPFVLTGKAPAACLWSGDQTIKLTVTTKAPGLVVYTANHFDHTGVAHNIGQYAGIALETQVPPSGTTDLSAITLLPGEHWQTWTKWAFNF
ncbi:aldose epimerase family protein [Agrilactobacillus yilanensis]|uniref:Maltose epimerase n=1 Tax=Agrilactobacillus yilanensis TaxID=2485997 RepID=A0ABW4J378_9LACO|nr:aldose epimerase family protein [Agrilactobacillus yilanensis]